MLVIYIQILWNSFKSLMFENLQEITSSTHDSFSYYKYQTNKNNR